MPRLPLDLHRSTHGHGLRPSASALLQGRALVKLWWPGGRWPNLGQRPSRLSDCCRLAIGKRVRKKVTSTLALFTSRQQPAARISPVPELDFATHIRMAREIEQFAIRIMSNSKNYLQKIRIHIRIVVSVRRVNPNPICTMCVFRQSPIVSGPEHTLPHNTIRVSVSVQIYVIRMSSRTSCISQHESD